MQARRFFLWFLFVCLFERGRRTSGFLSTAESNKPVVRRGRLRSACLAAFLLIFLDERLPGCLPGCLPGRLTTCLPASLPGHLKSLPAWPVRRSEGAKFLPLPDFYLHNHHQAQSKKLDAGDDVTTQLLNGYAMFEACHFVSQNFGNRVHFSDFVGVL